MKKTALRKYQRLEAAGLWRADPEAQRIDVIVSVGEATLTITDMRERVQTHWSIAAIARADADEGRVIYYPDGDPGETLELEAGEADMIAAIETLRGAVARQRPRPGRLRLVGWTVSAAAVLALLVLWLPGAARQHALEVVPQVKRGEIGEALLNEITRLAGPVCTGAAGQRALTALARRLPERGGRVPQLVVTRGTLPAALGLPGGVIVLEAALVEAQDEPDIAAGHVIAAHLRAEARDPLARLLQEGGATASLRLLATGELRPELLRAHAETLMRKPPAPLTPETLLAGFAQWQVRARPYAYALDPSGETTLPLIEADPHAATAPPPLLSDGDWLRLQGICGG